LATGRAEKTFGRDLAWLHPIVQREVQVERHLDRLLARDERSEGDDAAIARRKLRAFPDFAEQAVSLVFLKGWARRCACRQPMRCT
jgi:hypothetical protein